MKKITGNFEIRFSEDALNNNEEFVIFEDEYDGTYSIGQRMYQWSPGELVPSTVVWQHPIVLKSDENGVLTIEEAVKLKLYCYEENDRFNKSLEKRLIEEEDWDHAIGKEEW